MKITEAKCLNCGATLKVDADGVCQYCGTAFITQDVINNYNMTVVNNTTVNNNQYIATDNVNIVSGNFDNLYTNAIDSWNAHDYEDAYNKFTKALEFNPDSDECALYKALCFAILKRNLIGTANVITVATENQVAMNLQLRWLEHGLLNKHGKI
jgi:hypothetical protein